MVAEATAVHMTILVIRQEVAEARPHLHYPGHTASHNIFVVLVPPARLEEAAVLRFPRFSLNMIIKYMQ